LYFTGNLLTPSGVVEADKVYLIKRAGRVCGRKRENLAYESDKLPVIERSSGIFAVPNWDRWLGSEESCCWFCFTNYGYVLSDLLMVC